MNKQEKTKNGKISGRGIQWTDYTWNANAGCHHRCRWTMPDGSVAVCYAEEIANKFTRAYPQGFENHYWHPRRLEEPLKLAEPAKIFLDSMSDLMGHWVPEDQIHAVIKITRQAYWHTFQLLTKNSPRLLQFDFPDNVWVGASSPPDLCGVNNLIATSNAECWTKPSKPSARSKLKSGGCRSSPSLGISQRL